MGILTERDYGFIDIGMYGVKYDREMAVLPRDGQAPPLNAWRHLPMANLR